MVMAPERHAEMTMDLLDPKHREFLESLIIEGDLFAHESFVVTVKSRGRWYGRVSREAVQRFRGLRVPHLAWGTCKSQRLEDRTVVFACQWDDASEYTAPLIAGLAESAVLTAARAGCAEIAMPLFGGDKKERLKPAMGAGILRALDLLDEADEPAHPAPDVLVVVRPK